MENKQIIDINLKKAIKESAPNRYYEAVQKILLDIKNSKVKNSNYLGVFNVFKNVKKSDYEKIQEISSELLSDGIEYLVIIATQTIINQIKALVDLHFDLRKENESIKLVYVNENFNSLEVAKLLIKLQNKKFAINVISQTGECLETLIMFRELKNLLYKELGKSGASKYIYVTTNNNYGRLFNDAKINQYTHLTILDNTVERFLSYSPAILLPIACIGINIEKYLSGAHKANEFFLNAPLEKNSAVLYAITRKILHDNNFIFENICYFEQNQESLAKLWQMLFSETISSMNNRIYIETCLGGVDNKTLASNYTNTPFKCFDTCLKFQEPIMDCKISQNNENETDGLNYLSNLTYNNLCNLVMETFIENHVNVYKIPNIQIMIDNYNDSTLGWIMSFLHHSSILFAYLNEQNPFERKPLESYNFNLAKNFKELLGGKKND